MKIFTTGIFDSTDLTETASVIVKIAFGRRSKKRMDAVEELINKEQVFTVNGSNFKVYGFALSHVKKYAMVYRSRAIIAEFDSIDELDELVLKLGAKVKNRWGSVSLWKDGKRDNLWLGRGEGYCYLCGKLGKHPIPYVKYSRKASDLIQLVVNKHLKKLGVSNSPIFEGDKREVNIKLSLPYIFETIKKGWSNKDILAFKGLTEEKDNPMAIFSIYEPWIGWVFSKDSNGSAIDLLRQNNCDLSRENKLPSFNYTIFNSHKIDGERWEVVERFNNKILIVKKEYLKKRVAKIVDKDNNIEDFNSLEEALGSIKKTKFNINILATDTLEIKKGVGISDDGTIVNMGRAKTYLVASKNYMKKINKEEIFELIHSQLVMDKFEALTFITGENHMKAGDFHLSNGSLYIVTLEKRGEVSLAEIDEVGENKLENIGAWR